MEGHTTHTAITSYGYGTLCLKEGPNQLGPIFSTLFIYFVQFFSLINYSLRDPHYIRPRIFYFRDPISRLPFATPFRDPTRDSPSRLTFHDSTLDSHSQLMFTTPLVTHVRDSRSYPQLQLTFFTTSCRATPPLTDGLC